MTEQLYMDDPYLRECTATIEKVEQTAKKVTLWLDRTVFQPSQRDGGDRGHVHLPGGSSIYIGTVVEDRVRQTIEHRGKHSGMVQVGEEVSCRLDWAARYTIMRRHSASHLLYGCGQQLLGAIFPALSKTAVTSSYTRWLGQASAVDGAFLDKLFERANAMIAEGRPIHIEALERRAALDRLGPAFETIVPASATSLRLVTIEGLHSDPCIGLHVRDLREIGELALESVEREGDDIKIFTRIVPADGAQA
jgi:Ser-tRNA(Ala) deacylase AlaX